MRKAILFLLLVVPFGMDAQDLKITTFILVRHAEKSNDSKDPELSQAGVERSHRLSALLKQSNISAVYATNYKRTQSTVGPTSKEKNLPIKEYQTMTAEALKKIAIDYSGGTILIAGHSNTIPQIANTLLGRNEFQNFSESEYGTILVVSVVEVGKSASFVRLSY